MAFSTWFKPDGALQELTVDDLRREEHRLRIREEQLVARLTQVLGEKESAFRSGAENRSLALRRILARRFASGTAEQVQLERDLLRLGKDLGTVRAFLGIAEGNRKVKGLGDQVAELQVSYENDRVGEAAYHEALVKALGIAAPEFDPVAEVFRVWRGLDKGEYPSVAEARRALVEVQAKGEKNGGHEKSERG
jgi:hypothetical protein